MHRVTSFPSRRPAVASVALLAAALTVAGVAAAPAANDRDSTTAVKRDPVAVERDSAAVDPVTRRIVTSATLATQGAGRGQVVEPSGIVVDPFGRIYVSDASLHRVQRFDPDGNWLGESGALGSDLGQMRRPSAVTMLGSGRIGVLDAENRRVLTYDLLGRLIGTVVDLTSPALEGRLGRIDPRALAADRGGAFYLVDAGGQRLLVFDFAGELLRELGGHGAGPGLFRGLAAVAIGPRGTLLTAETVGGRIQHLSSSGNPIACWTLPAGSGGGGIAIAADVSGRVGVADVTLGSLWIYDLDGKRRAAAQGLGRPRALAFGPGGRLWVAEASPARVRRMEIEPPPGPAGER